MNCSSCKNSDILYAKGLCRKCYNRIYRETHREEIANWMKDYYEVHKEEFASYYLIHKEEIINRQKIYNGVHKKETAEWHKAYYETHKKEIANLMKTYWQTERGKEVNRSCSRKRRAMKASVNCWMPEMDKIWESLIEGTDGLCPACDKNVGKINLTMDHIIPISKGGLHHINNVRPLCKNCNCSKKDKLIN